MSSLFLLRVMLSCGVVGFIVWERIRNFLNSANIPARPSLVEPAAWLDDSDQGTTQSASAAAEYSTRAKVTTATPLAPLWVRQCVETLPMTVNFHWTESVRAIWPTFRRALRTQIYPRLRRARALRRLPHLPGVAGERQTT